MFCSFFLTSIATVTKSSPCSRKIAARSASNESANMLSSARDIDLKKEKKRTKKNKKKPKVAQEGDRYTKLSEKAFLFSFPFPFFLLSGRIVSDVLQQVEIFSNDTQAMIIHQPTSQKLKPIRKNVKILASSF